MPAVPAYKTMGFDPRKVIVPLSLLPGIRPVIIRGHNTDIDAGSVPEDLIEQGGVYTFPSAAVAVEIVSSSAADDGSPPGTGARTVLVEGLDDNDNEISEVVILNGTTPVALVNTYFRINSASVVTAGSGFTNAGNITIRVPGPGATLSFIGIGDSIAHQGIYTVPAGHTLLIQDVLPTLLNNSSTGVKLEIHTRDNRVPNSPFIVRLILGLWGFTTNSFEFAIGFPLFEKTDIRFRVTNTYTSDNNSVGLFCGALLLRTSTDSSS